MLRGLTAPWRQIIYYNFDTDMTRDILNDLILIVEADGFIATAMVNDLATTNVRLWNFLGLDISIICFTNPADSTR